MTVICTLKKIFSQVKKSDLRDGRRKRTLETKVRRELLKCDTIEHHSSSLLAFMQDILQNEIHSYLRTNTYTFY